MALSGRLASLALVLLEGACSPFGGGEFVCAENTQCTGGPGPGTCEPDGRCSFPDTACTSGRRYGGFAGDRSNTCVGGEIEPDGPDDPDAPVDSPFDAMIDSPTGTPFCVPTDPTLVACWQFEGNGTDGSSSNPSNTANTATGSFAVGKVGMGLVLNASSLITTGDRASLEPPNLSFEGWIRPSSLPTGSARMGVFDSGGAYGMFLNNQGTGLFCSMNGTVQASFAFPINDWTHVGCTTDGATVRMYINGSQVGTGAGASLVTGDTLGTFIGANSPSGEVLLGMIDQVRFWNVARTPAQMCAAAGKTTCP